MFPHGFGNGEAEAFGEALLDNDRGVALDGVDHGGVLVDIYHWKADEHDPLSEF